MLREEHPLLPPALLGLLALALYAGTIVVTGFDGLYGQDPFGYYNYAVTLIERARQLSLPPSNYWPIGYPALVALGLLALGPTQLAGQIVSCLAGIGAVVLVYALARELLGQEGYAPQAARRVAFVAGLLALVSGQLWLWSVTVMADAAALFWAALSGWALARYGRTWALPWLLLAAAALAAAGATRWVYPLMVVPLGVYWLLALRAPGAAPVRWSVIGTHLALAALAGLLVLAPQVLVSAQQPAFVLGHQWLVGWSPLNAVRREFFTPDGNAVYDLPMGLFYARAALSPRLFFPAGAPFLLIGAAVLWRRRMARAAALLGGWAGVMYAYLGGMPYQNIRYSLVLLPPLAIVAAVGLGAAWEWAGRRWGRGGARLLRLAIAAALALTLAGSLWYNGRIIGEMVARKETDLATVRWVERQIPPGGALVAFELTLTLRHYTGLDVYELYYEQPADLAALLADRPLYLLVDVADLEEQWAGTPVAQTYGWLRDGPGLMTLGRQHAYTLFRVCPTDGAPACESP